MTVQVHVWSDYVCPFCLIADELIDRAAAGREVDVVHHPHELRPYPTPTLRPEDEYLPSIWQRAVYPMARRYNVALTLPTISPQPYTDLAFRGSLYAGEHGLEAAYHRRMLTAFFRDGLDIGDRQVLTRLAAELGLDADGYREALDEPGYAARHREALERSAAFDIRVVPTIIIGDRRIDGVADVGVLRRAFEDAA